MRYFAVWNYTPGSFADRRNLLFWCALLIGTSIFAGGLSISQQRMESIAREFGRAAVERVKDWQALINGDTQASDQAKLKIVNDFFNRVRFLPDNDHWRQEDYWATPLETLTTNGGDCEDFVIGKYFSLRELGVDTSKLRITYVKALTLNQAHMVLAYYPSSTAEPVILDNLDGRILPASQRSDLAPVYSFNGDSLWLARELSGQGRLVGNSNRIEPWRRLVSRMESELRK